MYQATLVEHDTSAAHSEVQGKYTGRECPIKLLEDAELITDKFITNIINLLSPQVPGAAGASVKNRSHLHRLFSFLAGPTEELSVWRSIAGGSADI
jgi:hypothetical protein